MSTDAIDAVFTALNGVSKAGGTFKWTGANGSTIEGTCTDVEVTYGRRSGWEITPIDYTFTMDIPIRGYMENLYREMSRGMGVPRDVLYQPEMDHGRIVRALKWAAQYLGIKRGGFEEAFECTGYGLADDDLAAYHLTRRVIGFCPRRGQPSFTTIFHEAVHAWQDERGDDLMGAALRLREVLEREGAYSYMDAYLNAPHEVEAREVAAKMVYAYEPAWAEKDAEMWRGYQKPYIVDSLDSLLDRPSTP